MSFHECSTLVNFDTQSCSSLDHLQLSCRSLQLIYIPSPPLRMYLLIVPTFGSWNMHLNKTIQLVNKISAHTVSLLRNYSLHPPPSLFPPFTSSHSLPLLPSWPPLSLTLSQCQLLFWKLWVEGLLVRTWARPLQFSVWINSSIVKE